MRKYLSTRTGNCLSVLSVEINSIMRHCQLLEGDALQELRLIPNNSIDLILTSPPYNIGKEYEKKEKIDNYIFWQKSVIKECYRILNETGSICWQVGNFIENGEILPLDIALYSIFKELGCKLRNRIIWHFGHGLHCSKRFSGRYETILWFSKTDSYKFFLDPIRIPQKYPQKKFFKGKNKGKLSCNPLGKNPSDVWDIPNVKSNHIEKTIHPCQFPVELVERLVLSMTEKNDIVLDPFMGVASTGIASLMHKRKFIGIEILKKYVEIAKSRLEKASLDGLPIRPMRRAIYDPQKNNHVPPALAKITI